MNLYVFISLINIISLTISWLLLGFLGTIKRITSLIVSIDSSPLLVTVGSNKRREQKIHESTHLGQPEKMEVEV